MTFKATIFRVTTDGEGESKITFCCPSDQLEKVIPLSLLGGQVLNVSIEQE